MNLDKEAKKNSEKYLNEWQKENKAQGKAIESIKHYLGGVLERTWAKRRQIINVVCIVIAVAVVHISLIQEITLLKDKTSLKNNKVIFPVSVVVATATIKLLVSQIKLWIDTMLANKRLAIEVAYVVVVTAVTVAILLVYETIPQTDKTDDNKRIVVGDVFAIVVAVAVIAAAFVIFLEPLIRALQNRASTNKWLEIGVAFGVLLIFYALIAPIDFVISLLIDRLFDDKRQFLGHVFAVAVVVSFVLISLWIDIESAKKRLVIGVPNAVVVVAVPIYLVYMNRQEIDSMSMNKALMLRDVFPVVLAAVVIIPLLYLNGLLIDIESAKKRLVIGVSFAVAVVAAAVAIYLVYMISPAIERMSINKALMLRDVFPVVLAAVVIIPLLYLIALIDRMLANKRLIVEVTFPAISAVAVYIYEDYLFLLRESMSANNWQAVREIIGFVISVCFGWRLMIDLYSSSNAIEEYQPVTRSINNAVQLTIHYSVDVSGHRFGKMQFHSVMLAFILGEMFLGFVEILQSTNVQEGYPVSTKKDAVVVEEKYTKKEQLKSTVTVKGQADWNITPVSTEKEPLAVKEKDTKKEQLKSTVTRKGQADWNILPVSTEKEPLACNLVKHFPSTLQSEDKDQIKTLAQYFCEEFKKEMAASQKHILYDAWMGYIPDKESTRMKFTNIRIVAVFNKGSQTPPISTFHGIAIQWRQMDEVSSEAKETLSMEDRNVNVSHDITGQQAKDLFCSHSNLTMIHVSTFKSTKFKTKEQMIYKNPCVALYCRIKGVIPVGEDPFPSEIGGLKTDVREGYCTLAAGDELRPGAEIVCFSTNKSGTAGGFIEDESGRKGFITAAHVMTDCTQLVKDNAYKEQLFQSGTIAVHRGKPPHDELGKVVNGYFWNEDPNQTSVDVAVVEMDDKLLSIDGKFPETTEDVLRNTGYTRDNLPNIRNTMLTRNEIHRNKRADVLKYGAATALTLGKLSLEKVHVRFDDGFLKMVDQDSSNKVIRSREFQFFQQMGVFSTAKPFFEMGDSGAFCFMVDNNDDMTVQPFGMTIGISTAGICIVTPLEEIFKKLDFKVSLCPSYAKQSGRIPPSSSKKSKIGEPDDTKEMLQQIFKINCDMKTEIQNINSKVENVKSVMENVKSEVENVKSEVKNVKSEVENLKTEQVVATEHQ